MEVVAGKHVDKTKGVGDMSGDAGTLPECLVIH